MVSCLCKLSKTLAILIENENAEAVMVDKKGTKYDEHGSVWIAKYKCCEHQNALKYQLRN